MTIENEIWSLSEEVRGAIDGWDFKNYVLGLMFYRYMSETHMDYLEPTSLYDEVVKSNDDHLFKNVENAFSQIEQADGLAGIFDDVDLNSNKLGKDLETRTKRFRLLMEGIAKFDFNLEGDADVFGNCYEFMMQTYASNAGKSGGEYYTPPSVSELLTKMAVSRGRKIKNVYDPSCGSGSLLLKASKHLHNDELIIHGQEINVTTYNLARMNMILHNVEPGRFEIANDDTLMKPYRWDDMPFDLIVSNPPYSIKWEGKDNENLVNDERFTPAGALAPKSKADLAFVMHCLNYLSDTGLAYIVVFPGVLYRGGTEKAIRKYLIDSNYIDCIIGLPADMFYGTSIATCIMVLDKAKQDTNVQFIDASKMSLKEGKKNVLGNDDMERIIELYSDRRDVDYTSHIASIEEVRENDYNLSVSTYVEAEDTREKIDIVALEAEIARAHAEYIRQTEELDRFIAELKEDGIL